MQLLAKFFKNSVHRVRSNFFAHPFRLSPAPTNCPWVSEDESPFEGDSARRVPAALLVLTEIPINLGKKFLRISCIRKIAVTSILCTSQIEASTSPPPRGIPRHLTPFPGREGGHLITTHRRRGIWSLASILCYESRWIPGDGGDKLWWIQRKTLRICGGVIENQRPTQALFRIWRCLRTIYI